MNLTWLMNPSSLVEVLAAVHPVHEVEVAHLVVARRPHPHGVVLLVLHGAPEGGGLACLTTRSRKVTGYSDNSVTVTILWSKIGSPITENYRME